MKSRGLLLLPILLLATLATVERGSANFSVYITFNDAYYADLDMDGLADDIRLDLTIELYTVDGTVPVDLYIGITLPSGQEYWFLVQFTVYKYSYYFSTGMKFNAYDTATEPGWYEASAAGFTLNDQYTLMESIIFDPPGGYTKGNPTADATFY